MADSDLVLGGRRHRDGEPGDRLCHVQDPRKQAGLPPLIPRRGLDRRPTEPAETLVELRDVSLRFVTYHDKQYSLKRSALDLLLRREAPPVTNEFWALRDVNLQMNKGERIGILGFNGAGKSTLLRLLARIYTPTRGS